MRGMNHEGWREPREEGTPAKHLFQIYKSLAIEAGLLLHSMYALKDYVFKINTITVQAYHLHSPAFGPRCS